MPRAFRFVLSLTRFDAALLAILAALGLAIVGVLLRGDQVGVTVTGDGYGPRESVPGTDPITITFSEPMQPETVEARLRTDPAETGQFAWSADGRSMTFTPARARLPGTAVTMTLEAGALAVNGRKVREALRWSFSIQPPRVVALAPSDSALYNLYRADVALSAQAAPLTAAPLTAARYGIEDYAVGPDGHQIAYSQRSAEGTLDLWLLDLASGQTRPLTQCVNALCTHPAWSPDGSQIAYERRDFNAGPGGGLTPARAWVVDVVTLDTRLLLDDPAILGQDPIWSPDGSRIALYDASLPGIRVRDLNTRAETRLATQQDTSGAFSPDGTRLVYPVLIGGTIGPQLFVHLNVIDLASGKITSLEAGDTALWDDGEAVWSPDGTALIVARQYLDERYTPGKQLFRVDPASGEAEALIVDAAYAHSAPRWDATGQRLLFQRYPLVIEGGANGTLESGAEPLPELWTYDRAANTLQRVMVNAFFPAWIP